MTLLKKSAAVEAKENCQKLRADANWMTGVVEASYSNTFKGSRILASNRSTLTRTNSQAIFDFFGDLVSVKSPSHLIELSTAHVREAVRRGFHFKARNFGCLRRRWREALMVELGALQKNA